MLNIPEKMLPPKTLSWMDITAKLPKSKQEAIFARMKDQESVAMATDWFFRARREQIAPNGDWFLWIMLAGRGFGKNWAGSNNFIEAHRLGLTKSSAIVAATTGDLRKYCLEGPSGILSTAPKDFMPKYLPSQAGGGVLKWPNDVITNLYSSEKPRRIRGGNFDLVWCDEMSWWQYPQETWNQLMFATRVGSPKIIVTMTPRPIPLIKDLIGREDGKKVIVTRGSTFDNIKNLSEVYIEEIIKPYEGTTIGRQELQGEILMDVDGALWNHEQLERLTIGSNELPDELDMTVVAIDPSISKDGDECGIVSAGRKNKRGYVLGDHSIKGTPNEWARKAIHIYHSVKDLGRSSCIVAEKNQGGEMVRTTLHNIDATVPVKLVHASVGKVARAEPVHAIYEQNRIFHCGHFPALEDEMCMFVPGEITVSPNRVDAMVWAMTHLLVKNAGVGRIGAWGRRKAA